MSWEGDMRDCVVNRAEYGHVVNGVDGFEEGEGGKGDSERD